MFCQKTCLESAHVEGIVPRQHQDCFRNKISWSSEYHEKFIYALSAYRGNMSFPETQIDPIRQAMQKIRNSSIAAMIKHVDTIYSFSRNVLKNRLPNRRFFVGIHRRHAKHLDACGYIALLITGGQTFSIS